MAEIRYSDADMDAILTHALQAAYAWLAQHDLLKSDGLVSEALTEQQRRIMAATRAMRPASSGFGGQLPDGEQTRVSMVLNVGATFQSEQQLLDWWRSLPPYKYTT